MSIEQFSLYKPIVMFALFSIILLFSQSSVNSALAQGNNLWYVGDGVKMRIRIMVVHLILQFILKNTTILESIG
jgi:hypothetical protein